MSTFTVASAPPVVFVFSIGNDFEQSLVDSVHGNFMGKLSKKATVVKADNNQAAVDLLTGGKQAHAVVVTDPAICHSKNGKVLQQLVKFVKSGGRLVLGLAFSSNIEMDRLSKFLGETWGLPWTPGEYHRDIHTFNSGASGVSVGYMPGSYRQKALCLSGVKYDSAWYMSTTESKAFFDSDSAPSVSAPIAFTKVGAGWLGYIGDVNGEEETSDVILGMLGLL